MQKKNLCFTFPEETGNENIIIMHCDLSDLESVQKFSKDFLAKESALHILINNAGKLSRKGPSINHHELRLHGLAE